MTQREIAQERLQELATKIREIVDEMVIVAQENEITSIPFLGGGLQFGVQFEGPTRFSREGEVQNLSGYVPAAKGALMTEGHEWRASYFECWPQTEQREWLFGEDSAKWPKTDYEID